MNIFVGELPPPYGGVAVKDKLLFQEVYESVGVKMINLVECKWKPWKIPLIGIKLIIMLLIANHVIVGVGTNERRKVLMAMRRLLRGKKGLRKTHMIAMGGMIQECTKTDKQLKGNLIKLGSVWVETEGMKNSLEEQGFTNIKIFPNCRSERDCKNPSEMNDEIRYVFFSRICREKGVDEIIEATPKLKGEWSLDFYGEVATDYKEEFLNYVNSFPNVKYHGVYDSTLNTVYEELNQYDVMLLPTKWVGEGVSGTLVESKMAGLMAVATDWNFNSEVVRPDEGIVYKGELSEALNGLTIERCKLFKDNAYASRKRYCTATYKELLLKELE